VHGRVEWYRDILPGMPTLLASAPLVLAACILLTGCAGTPPSAADEVATSQAVARPNILVAIADDWSWPHAGAYGDPAVRTPVFDRLAREGMRFSHAYVAAPSCSPSRAAVLTGQYPHRLEEGSQLHGFLPARFAVYPELLAAEGYHAGSTRKGWGPGRLEPAGRVHDPAGPKVADFRTFLAERPEGAPFVFWFGSQDPHRPYEPGAGARAGIDPARVAVPAFLPDTPEVRADIADYLFEVERFDREVGEMIALLEAAGELDRTLVIVTSDNGMPFPRAKATVYDGGTRVPLVARWPGQIRAGATSEAMVSLVDLAPTFLDVAGLPAREDMSGRSLRPVWRGEDEDGRDRVFLQRERHANVRRGDLSYPSRAVRTRDHLYIRNLRPDRWPAGDPELYHSVGPFGDIDGGPSKQVVLDGRGDPALAPFFALATAKRPAEELYVLADDPDQLRNVAGDPAHAQAQAALRQMLDAWMRDSDDPRATSDDDRWDRYPYFGGPAASPPAARPAAPAR
jgi:N-sulfoglucosamine sulfohydrolase